MVNLKKKKEEAEEEEWWLTALRGFHRRLAISPRLCVELKFVGFYACRYHKNSEFALRLEVILVEW